MRPETRGQPPPQNREGRGWRSRSGQVGGKRGAKVPSSREWPGYAKAAKAGWSGGHQLRLQSLLLQRTKTAVHDGTAVDLHVMVSREGFEPSTRGLRVHCSAT